MVGARVLADDEDRVRFLKIFEADGSFAHADHVQQGAAA
jgi:hypothetical protein